MSQRLSYTSRIREKLELTPEEKINEEKEESKKRLGIFFAICVPGIALFVLGVYVYEWRKKQKTISA